MVKLYILVFSLLGVLGGSVGQILQFGQCNPNIQLVQNFDVEEFLGTWHEIARAENTVQNGHCSRFEFDRVGDAITVYGSSVVENFVEDVYGTASVENGTSRLTLTMPQVSNNTIDFWVILTDYITFAVTYGCENVGNTQRRVYLWQLGRETQYPNQLIPALLNTTMNNLLGITTNDLQSVSFSEESCYILPSIGYGEPVILTGQCDENITVAQNFDAARFTGVWHEIASYYSESALGNCPRAEYSLGNGVVNVVNSHVINQTLLSFSGYASVISNDGSAKLSVVLEIAPNVTAEQELWVIATDYSQYAISYSCNNLANNQKRVYSWIVSRTRQLPATAQTQVNEVINSILELNNRYFEQADQSDASCFYYPEPVPNQPVVFRGQCDQTIPAVANFDPVRYMGLWHDIESYPMPFQDGTCSNAQYTLVGGEVDVYNTQVINQALDTINGVAVLASTDGTGKLLVTFPVAGTNFTITTNYWVLSTDYTNYALVYSCSNLNADEMQVSSWKLSRTKQLAAASAVAINNVISTIPVLEQQYYQNMDQSPEGCFYYPEPQVGVPVVFPGQCDENVPVVSNFNLNQFQGLWHEIEAYPKEEQPGQCINHQFTVAGNTFNLQSSNVLGQILDVTNAVVSFSSTDNSAKLVITITSNGTVITIPFWIVSTDYNNYALAYSCVNINSDYRGVWSWKLSRTKELSAASNLAINNATAAIDVLDNIYYETISQTEDACFYLPDIPPGQPVVFSGQCDANITVMQNFNAARYLGRWRLIETYPSEFQVGTCNEATYSLGTNGTVIVYNTEVINQTLDSIYGSAVVASTDGSGKLLVTFPNAPAPIEYWILDTDYESYSLVYSCVNINSDQRRVWSWKMSRTNSLTQIATTAINQVVNRVNVLNDRYFQVVDRSDTACFYYPTPDGNAVIFRGQCDQNIPVVTNFDAARYTGLWHDIESYPTAFQDGTCNNALYTLVGGQVDVFNTQVINQTLDTITAVAVLATTDGTAKLLVTFPIAGTNLTITTDYWVLATDYVSYSLVYSCMNLNDETRQVTSWKLSRTKALTAASATAINNLVNTVPVLDQQYYINRDHSPEGCFYYPEPQAGVPVVFPGQCDENVPVVSNFNLNQFQGLWHEIEAYPKEDQPGQCINHQFTVAGNTFNLQSSNVLGQILDVTNGVVSFSSNDTSAKLVITITSNGTVITIPFWIVSTDYNNYALAYSCVNINNDYRGVWSWKLSRTKELSAASNLAINSATSAIDVLDNIYYETISQTDDACFYLPDIPPGQPVVFSGQCDANITVMQNFNAARYLGLWRLIETYPSEFQVGTCNEATYSLGTNGTVIVYNTEVINQTLDFIYGSAVVASTDGSGKLLVTFPNAPAPIEYWILDTDYDTYSLVYSCVNLNSDQRRVWSWKMSRTNSLTQNATTAINQVVNSVNVLNDRYYQVVDRSDAGCFYYPTPDGNPVVFRGQCDQSIPVVTNFDAARYTGLWHDIESYPTTFQNGTCNNAIYTLVGGQVDVYNTQVINQTLDTINGVAVLATTDGTAKLLVTFPVVGTNLNITTNYWVLATDYVSYSLVYSCMNLDDEYRQVTSWKMSRTKALTAAASTAINNVVNSIPVLDQQYYLNRDQSPEGCFYYPEPQAGVPVVFPGQCDENVPVVSNFNLNQFQGLWHEIEAYPKEEQPGQCINHQFTVAGNTFNLQSSNVLGQILDVTNGVVSFSSNDTSAKLVITITSNGTVITIPFWIVSTDYNNYALAYSCVNINSDYRGVWSWKLSRTKELSAASNLAINSATSAIDVLDNIYYETISQTDDACFYLPDIPPGQPVVFSGQCDANITVVQNFNASRYLGRWRLIETYPSEFQVGTCNEATYSLGTDGTVIVYNTEVINQTLDSIYGSAVVASTDGSGKLLVTFPNAPAPIEYWILDTDYDTYSLVYSCVNLNSDQRRVWSWKMSRTNSLNQNDTNAINQVVNSINVLNDRYYQVVDRSDAACFYYPTPDGNPVVFRGQCNPNISVVTNFDAARYTGLWHDIESYPTTFQNGTCNNAIYTLVGGQVDVYNTQVINQTLDTINGVAVLATTDGTAKLLVTFPVVGTNLNITTDYWVLATDYVSYSLVYSCMNLDDEYRQVTSWKMSRTKALTAAATTAINTVVNTIPVLDQQYYLNRDQSPEGCFYYPEPQAGVPVVFPGQCDENLPVVSNFNLNQFQGLWHEIEAYPKEEQPGQCINHQFTVAGNTFNLQSSNVLGQVLDVTNGVVSFSSNDTSAKLVITITSNGTVITIPFWIVSTDYNNYALAYSCVNINNDYRGVWSWKLSRTKQMTAAGNLAINNAVATIDVLDNIYYEPISQTDDACFYLPDTPPGQPVVFPGQCDTNITVVQNFNAARYLGLWRLIETYPSEFQVGTCNEATYSLGTNGTVIVYNTEVINQTLDSIYGSAVVASTDGSGKLLVTFPTAPAPIEYWILDTDYETYSLVYSCVNINSDQRRVWSWKMSRTNNLNQNATTAINQVVNNINVLNDRYYQIVDRSDAGCFYYPTPDSTSPVVFRGQCDENIPVVANFDVARYLGLWYDIESYPTIFQDGTCSNALYTFNNDGTVFVYNTQVVNQVLDTMSGTAVLASTDGSAKLSVTFPSVNATTEYWVLATDYESFSFVYSCRNIDSYYRQVSSWKLSRQQNLTAAAITAINNVMSPVQVLEPQYFVETGQSDDDCFYYPDNNGGDVILDGQCIADNQVDTITNFNANAFTGTWHEVARFPSDLQVGECASSEYVTNGLNAFNITQSIVYDEQQTSSLIPATLSSDGRGVISASISGVPVNTFFILDTDYNEYALLYACRNLNTTNKQIYSWKLSRTREGLSAVANNRIDEIVSNNIDLFEGYYDYTNQSNDACFHYPDFQELPSSIILPGPCDERITAVPNFNAAAYLGRWIEIARYPTPDQFGQCDRAHYSLGNDTVDVSNTQVVNTTLLTQLGYAVVASNDYSGLLNVTFVVNGVTVHANYYVLATDYTSYALVYSCRNLNNGDRQVSSWKVSRTTSLSAQANTAMDVVIRNTQGLLESYYQNTSQSDDDCFYIPEVNPYSSVVFRGQCENIVGVQNFNIANYVGWWHEIERYPSDGNVGECTSSQYEASGNQYLVVDTSVTNGVGQLVSGTVEATADGRLRRTLSDGRVEDVWVLATDYETYSLLYTCENIDSEYRRVWSAKHSKTRQLTQAAQNATASIIENNRVLYPQFYLPVNQSDSACFHYPAQTGQQVILPGQCDENIPVVQNFDAVEYAGTWYQIERYPQIHEDGTCIGARYVLDETTGIVDVLNWEVINGALETINGTATITSTDGSAKLSVILPVLGTNETVTTPLYVLTTDYESYSLAYSCVNINSFQRSVGAWKLSRTRTMPTAGTTAINAYMAQREELYQPYFITIEQNDDCEEPSSAILVKSSIIVMLVCVLLQLLV